MTNQGVRQRVTKVNAIDVSVIGDEAVAWSSIITVQGQVVHGGLASVHVGDYLTHLQVISVDPIDPSLMHDLTAVAATRLN
jgi:hypothetical protein